MDFFSNPALWAGLIILICIEVVLSLDNLACVTRAELARLNQLGWRNLSSPEARKALIAEAKLLTQAHRRARDLGLNWGQRRRLLPQRAKIAAPQPEATHA